MACPNLATSTQHQQMRRSENMHKSSNNPSNSSCAFLKTNNENRKDFSSEKCAVSDEGGNSWNKNASDKCVGNRGRPGQRTRLTPEKCTTVKDDCDECHHSVSNDKERIRNNDMN